MINFLVSLTDAEEISKGSMGTSTKDLLRRFRGSKRRLLVFEALKTRSRNLEFSAFKLKIRLPMSISGSWVGFENP